MSKESFFLWQDKFFVQERKFFIDEGSLDRNRIPVISTLIIYEQCINQEKQETNCNACEYAWLLCGQELFQIFAGQNSLTVACQSQKFVLKR